MVVPNGNTLSPSVTSIDDRYDAAIAHALDSLQSDYSYNPECPDGELCSDSPRHGVKCVSSRPYVCSECSRGCTWLDLFEGNCEGACASQSCHHVDIGKCSRGGDSGSGGHETKLDDLYDGIKESLDDEDEDITGPAGVESDISSGSTDISRGSSATFEATGTEEDVELPTGATGSSAAFEATGIEDGIESTTGTEETGIVAPTGLETLLGDVIDSTGSTGTAATGTSQELKPEEEVTPDTLDEDWYVWNSVPNDAFGGLRGSVRGWDSGWRR